MFSQVIHVISSRSGRMSARIALWMGFFFAGMLSLSTQAAVVNVAVNTGTTIAVTPLDGVGLGTSVYANQWGNASLSSRLIESGVQSLRYPGGSYSDIYHWSTGYAQGGYAPSNSNFGNFVNIINSIGATAMITVDYGSAMKNNGQSVPDYGGQPGEAGAWVAYANGDASLFGTPSDISLGVDQQGNNWRTVGYWAKLRASTQAEYQTWATPLGLYNSANNFLAINHDASMGIKNWEIGNEVGGNGYFGDPGWEADYHAPYDGHRQGNSKLSPTTYANNLILFSNAMKAVDPTIKIGTGLNGYPSTADQQILSNAGNYIDFAVLHWYPYISNDSQAFQRVTSDLPTALQSIRNDILHYTSKNPNSVPIYTTEFGPGSLATTAAGIFVADAYITGFENGASGFDFQEMSTGTFLGDGSSLTRGTAFYGLEAAAKLADPGSNLVQTTSGSTAIRTHAVVHSDGSVTVMIINENYNATGVNLSLGGNEFVSNGQLFSTNMRNSANQTAVSGLGNNFTAYVNGRSIYEYTIAPTAQANATWNLTGGGTWGAGIAWNWNRIPQSQGDKATFGNSINNASTTITLDDDRTLSSLTFNNTLGGSYTISSGTSNPSSKLILANGGADMPITVSAGNHSITAPVEMQSNVNINTASGTQLTFSNQISESGGPKIFTKSGKGKAILSGNNSYTGGTDISDGVLEFANAGAIPTAGNINVNGGLLRFTSNTAVPPAGSVVINTGGALEANASDPYNTVTAWLGSGKIASGSTGAIALSATSIENIDFSATGYNTLSLGSSVTGVGVTYTGTLTPAGSTYYLGGGGGTLTLSNINAVTGAGKSLVVGGPGLVVLSGSNDYTGGTTLNGGTLSYTNDNSIGGALSAITFNGGTLTVPAGTANDLGSHTVNWSTFNGGFNVTTGDTFTVTQQMQGAGSLTKDGAGTLTLTNSNTFTGGTTLNAGTLQLSGGDNRLAATGAITITGGTLDLGGNTQNTSGAVAFQGGTVTNGTIYKTGAAYNAQSGTVSAILTGTAGMTKSGSDLLTLSAANTYTGGTTINSGFLQLSGGDNRLATTGAITITGGTLDLGGYSQGTSLLPQSGAVSFQGGTVQNGTIYKSGTAYDGQAGDIVATLAGAVGLTKNTSGALYLYAVNTFSGGTTINAGTLQLVGGNNRLLNSGDIIIKSGGTLDLDANSQSTTGVVSFQGGTVQNGTLSKSGVAYDAQSGTVSAVLSGAAGLVKSNTGTLTLTGANTYSGGTTINAGTLTLSGGDNRLAPSRAITITGGTLNLGGQNQGTSSSPQSGAVSFQGGIVQNGTIYKSSTAYGGQAGTVSAILAGTAGLTKTTTDMLILSGANTYSGGTTISAGTLQLSGGNNRLYTSGAITLSGGTLDLGNYSQSTSGAVSFQSGTVQNGTITKSGAAYDAQAGTISAILAGSVGLTKTTSGTLTLSGSNTYTGATQISGGVLGLASTGQIDTDSAISTDSTATFQINGGTHTVGTISGTGALNVTSGVLTAASIVQNTVTLGAGATLVIGALPGGPLAVDSGLSAVPEPSTFVLLGLAAATLCVYLWRRRV